MTRPLPILVINPNSNPAVTDGLRAATAAFRLPAGPEIECITLTQAPPGIESQADIEAVEPLLLAEIATRRQVSAVVLACYSDPAIDACRRAAGVPVLGIQESALSVALTLGQRIGVLAIQSQSVDRHLAYVRRLGLEARLAGERPLNISVAESASGEGVSRRLESVGRQLIEQDGADVLILGCAGLSRQRRLLQETLGVQVIDPTQAAVGLALMAILSGGECGEN